MTELNEAVASSSSERSSAVEFKYDVFLSFRGPDTRKSITSQLYYMLQNKRGIITFMDGSDVVVGDPISPTLLKAIEDSRFAIVILSPNYASSTWCLEELTKICECMIDDKRIFPLFYNVEPSDVRFCKESFRVAFNKHESSGRHSSDKMQQWRDALNKVACFSGWNTQNFKTDEELVNTIVNFVCGKVQPTDIEFAMCTGDFRVYEALKKAMKKVMEALEDDEVTAIGVYGMGGVGKSTMVEHVAAQARRKGIFEYVVMAVVSQNHNIGRIQKTLLAKLLGPEKFPEIERASRLYEGIMRKSNILIILDDIWGFINLPKIGIPSHDKLRQCNSKVLLTTRRLHVCNSMRSQVSIPLDILSEEDSWSLFLKQTERTFDSREFEDVAKRVARECRGLPIALVAVARALRDKDLVEWQKAAQQLKKSQIANPDHDDDAFECIKLSYDYLKDKEYKLWFLLCCLFPEDYDIPIEDLFKYAIGNGLFQDTDTMYEARGIADSLMKHLKDSSLLMEGRNDGHVRMHDVVRDTAVRIANLEDGHGFLVKARCGLDDWSCRSHKGYSAISLMVNSICRLPDELVCPNLQILLLQRNTGLSEIPESFFQSPNELRVLDLSLTRISLLPQSFSLLTNLQALNLNFCYERIDISMLRKLKKLVILSMIHYPHKELSREIGHLTSLRMLDVSGTEGRGIVTIPSGVISKLQRLEELYMMYCGFQNWERQIEEEGEEINIGFGELAALSKLKNLHVSISKPECIPKYVEVEPGWVYFHIRIGRYTRDRDYRFYRNSRFLSLYETTTTISILPNWFVNTVTSKAEKIEYRRCKGLSDIVMEYDHGRLHELKHLKLCDIDSEELMNTARRVLNGPVFEELEELYLLDLMKLKELCVGELPSGSLFNLKVLHIEFCHNLKSISKFVQRLPNLEKLYLNGMFDLENVFQWEGLEPPVQSKLREMQLLGPNSLKSICSGLAQHVMFQSLKSLTIYQCKLLQSLFTSGVAESLVQLEDLFVEWCPLLERVIEEVNDWKTVLPKLKNLVLKGLPVLYGACATVDIECPSLESLNVVDCPQSSFSTSSALFNAVESWNHISFSTSASHYFGSKNLIKLNVCNCTSSCMVRMSQSNKTEKVCLYIPPI